MDELVNIFKDGSFSIPIYMLKNYKKLKLKINEFVFLMYLYNKGNNFLFNPDKISKSLNIDLTEVMGLISVLTDKGLIRVDVIKNDKGYMEDVVIMDDFYKKLSLIIMDDVNVSKSNEIDGSSIFDLIEKEFGRTLGPIEIEIIKGWLENNFSEELIKEALKEATFNGVSNLRYIDKILYEWSKKGKKTAKDVAENREKRNESKSRDEEKDIDLDTLEWNWFDGDE